jgi:hypothetical protein
MSNAPAARRACARHQHPAAETEDEAEALGWESHDDEMQVSHAGTSYPLEEPQRIQQFIYALLSHGMLLCCGSLPSYSIMVRCCLSGSGVDCERNGHALH